MRENLFPPIIEDIYNLFIFYEKKQIFRGLFYFLRPAFGHGRVAHPQSLEYLKWVTMNQIFK